MKACSVPTSSRNRLRPVWPADPQKGPFPKVLQTIRRLLIRPGRFRLERELPGRVCTNDICALWQGTQWNKIEHRLFAFITRNWRGKPLVSHAVIVQLIGATTTETGLQVCCEIDPNLYPRGIQVSDAEMQAINLMRAEFPGEWNYTIAPNQQQP
jgi:Rhodopirellula transposase DDE domain